MGFISKKLMAVANSAFLKWNQASLPFSAPWFSNVEYGNGKFVAIPSSSFNFPATNKMVHSDNGITWTQGTLPINFNCNSLEYGDSKFVAVGTDVDYTYTGLYSINGINWQTMLLPTQEIWESIAYGGGKFVAVPRNTSRGAYSANGINWTQMTLPTGDQFQSTGFSQVIYADGKFVVIPDRLAVVQKGGYSTDGINWTGFNMPTTGYWVSIAYGNGKYVAISSPKTVNGECLSYVSSDGINWTQWQMPSALWQSITYGNGIFLASSRTLIPETGAAQNAIAAYSVDGINWIQTLMPPYYSGSLTYNNSRFFSTVFATRNSDGSLNSNSNVLLYTDLFPAN